MATTPTTAATLRKRDTSEPGALVIATGTLVIIVGLVMVIVSLLSGVIADASAPLDAGAGELPSSVVIARSWTLIGAVLTFFGLATMAVGYLRQINHRVGLLSAGSN